MSPSTLSTQKAQPSSSARARRRLLAALPVAERSLELAGITTTVLEGGAGSPVVLLHGPGESAAKWSAVIPSLVKEYRVIAPDLPGHGGTLVAKRSLAAQGVMEWLGELVERTCPSPPVLVGQLLGGAIAARFTAESPGAVARLVLVDALGLATFAPTPEFGKALGEFAADPDGDTYDRLWTRCAFDLEALRERLGSDWNDFKTHHLDRARRPELRAIQGSLMEQFGLPALPPATLAAITVPTHLIWGRHDLATDLTVAELASARYGWPLAVIDDAGDDPPFERPQAFLRALRPALH